MRKNRRRKLILTAKALLEEEYGICEAQLDVLQGQLLQEKAMLAGTILEEEGQETDTIYLLETYCEYVYQRSIRDEPMLDLSIECVKLLEKFINKIDLCIPEEKNKILFMPYKSCMWDSMESIYDSALQDREDWDVVVMPLPYRLKLENRQICEEAFFINKEGFRSYLDYNIEEERPDVVVIHNPYDQYNKISEVEKEFFSQELKKYTRHLVYIPYFTAQKDYTKVDKIILPGIRNATDIFVQSKKIKGEYLRWYPDKNIKALGSPKIDRLVNKTIEGNNEKKTFLLNTHLYMVQNIPELLVTRISQILDFFSVHLQYRLIWRPHPLSLSSFTDGRQRARYQEIVERAKQMDNVYYDQEKDFFQSISKAGAYMGDISSLVSFFGIMGKPIYLFEREDRNLFCWDEYLNFLDYQFYQGRIWMVGRKTPGIYSMDYHLSDVKLEYNLLSNIKKDPYRHYLSVRFRGNEAFVFFEDRACVQKINLDTGEEKEIQFAGIMPKELYVILDIYEYHGAYYLIPASKGFPLLRFDGENFFECTGWEEKLEELVGGGQEQRYWMEGYCNKENKLWFAILDMNQLIQVNLEQMEVTSWEIAEDDCKLEIAVYDGEKFWLVGSAQRALYQWSIENGLEEVYDNFPQQIVLGAKYSFVKIVFFQDTVWCIPGSASAILIFDKQNREFRVLELPELIWLKENEREKSEKFHAVIQRGDELILFANCTRQHLVIDMSKEKIIRIVETFIREEDLRTLQKEFLKLYNECTSDVCSLSDFISFVEHNYRISQEEKERYMQGIENAGDSGTRIWEEIKNWD